MNEKELLGFLKKESDRVWRERGGIWDNNLPEPELVSKEKRLKQLRTRYKEREKERQRKRKYRMRAKQDT